LSKEFDGVRAVDSVSLSVTGGLLTALIGPNGAGKTTLFNLVSGTVRPSGGKVLYKGRDITGEPAWKISQYGIARSFQITNVFPNLSVVENIRLSAQSRIRPRFDLWSAPEKYKVALEKTGRIIAEMRLQGRELMLASMLSHGDQRKLEIAMTLAQDPELMLLDEPTAGVAIQEIPELMAVIRSIKEQRRCTILLVEHKMDVVMGLSDRIVVMNDGKVIAEGAPSEVQANSLVQDVYLGRAA